MLQFLLFSCNREVFVPDPSEEREAGSTDDSNQLINKGMKT